MSVIMKIITDPVVTSNDDLGLGADAFVDLQADRLEDVGEVDVAFDMIGGEVLERSAPLVRADGTLLTIVGPPKGAERLVR
jgi:NADPH:quinone reductase-like Zn-dependent oxidoreductase